ncbi:transmembrane protein 147 [Coccinella septempunctata]|uniref:transmembrane protein 147 n=1 Tax=Coccinella septempunctata TaxID=41139 RepID=UPI001D063405|nr:transmembrane protein 147 [Coccinella septempunctata]
MTLYHFGNCVALIYVPYYLTYKYAGLSEYGAFWKCFQAGGIYMCTQLVKMLILATFFPDNILETSGDYFGEFLKATVDLGDLIGLYIVLMGIPGKSHSKVLTAGMGWAVAEVILTRALFLWVGARGAEFDWKYIRKCLESNISLVNYLNITTLIWLWSRHDLKVNLKPLISALLLMLSYKSLAIDILLQSLMMGPWIILLIKGAFTLVVGSVTLIVYAALTRDMGVY